jgi:energy-converting hydrogenase Eha subunit E
LALNDREIALLIWLGVTVIACVVHPGIRPSLISVLKAFGRRQILVVIGLLYAFLGLTVWLLSAVGLWYWDQLKTTLVWSVVVGIASLMQINTIEDQPHFFRDWIMESLKVVAIVEFVVTFYAFPLWAELILQPLLFVIVGTIAFSKDDPKNEPAMKVLNGFLALFGMGLVFYAVYMIAVNLGSFLTLATLRDFYTPIVLSILFVPFIFVLHVYSAYERTFRVLRWAIKDNKLRRYAKIKVILSFGPRVALLRRWQINLGAHRPGDREDIHRAIQEIKESRRRERHPILVSPERGWSPHIAKDFLAEFGLVTKHYHRLYDEWYAGSPMLELGKGVFPNNLAYYVEGGELIALRLKLNLNVNEVAESAEAQGRFVEIGNALLNKATGHRPLRNASPMETVLGQHRIAVKKDEWSGDIKGGYDLMLTIEMVEWQRSVP